MPGVVEGASGKASKRLRSEGQVSGADRSQVQRHRGMKAHMCTSGSPEGSVLLKPEGQGSGGRVTAEVARLEGRGLIMERCAVICHKTIL